MKDDFKTAKRILQSLVGENGLELTTEVDIPKGSGLGTSSILMLACVRSLRKLFGINCENDEDRRTEFNAVLAIEQMLTTGGGWQVRIKTQHNEN